MKEDMGREDSGQASENEANGGGAQGARGAQEKRGVPAWPAVLTAKKAVTAEEIGARVDAMFEAGIEQFHREQAAGMARAAARREQLEAEEDEDYARDLDDGGGEEARRRREIRDEELDRLHFIFNPAYPAWRQLSGIFPQNERAMNPSERARRIRLLLAGAERLLRHELRHCVAVEDPIGARWTGPSLQWDPLRSVCVRFEMAQRTLSAFAKEQTGLSAPEMVDCIRAEDVRGKMKAQLRAFILQKRGFTTENTEGYGGPHPRPLSQKGRGENNDEADEIWRALKETRKAPRWHRTTWAAEYGFSSYSRFFRACLMCYGLTPHQLEIELIEEILEETDNSKCNGGHEDHEDGRKGHEGRQGDEKIVMRE